MLKRMALVLLFACAGCSKILGFSEATHRDAGPGDAVAADSTDASGQVVVCKFDDSSSTFESNCVFGQ